MSLLYKEESYEIIGAAMEVHKQLGNGFLEAVYQEALSVELESRKIPFEKEFRLEVSYKGNVLSKYYIADFICYDNIIVEIKAVNELSGVDESQVINYLKAANMKLGILINFGSQGLEYKRLIRY